MNVSDVDYFRLVYKNFSKEFFCVFILLLVEFRRCGGFRGCWSYRVEGILVLDSLGGEELFIELIVFLD